VRHSGAVIVLPEATHAWPLDDPSKLTVESLSPVLAAAPPVEILLYGCGRQLVAVDESIRARLRAAGIVIEAMDTGAACRTFGVLVAEERRVAAALIAVD
jgi:uncharacterized protein